MTFQDGSSIVESENECPTWDDVPRDKRIMQVALTDGVSLVGSLSGCDFYVVVYEGEMRMQNRSSILDGEQRRGPSRQIVAQHLYGLRDLTQSKRFVRNAAWALRRELADDGEKVQAHVGENSLLLKGQRLTIAELQHRAESIINKINGLEVEGVSLMLSHSHMPRKDFNESPEGLREGVSYPPTDEFKDQTKAELLRW